MPAYLAFYLTLGLLGLLTLLLLGQVWRRPNQQRRPARLAASVLAVAALGCLLLPPQRDKTPAATDSLLLLTEGVPADSLRYWQRRLGSVPRYRFAPPSANRAPGTISSLAELNRRFPQLRQLHVLGQGVPAADLNQLAPAVRVTMHPTWPAAAFRMASWSRELNLGEALRIEGHFAADQRGPVQLYLYAAGRARDSVRLPTGSGAFSLRYQPRITGPQLLQLEARRQGRTLAAEPVATVVQPPRPLRLLLLAGSPSFEQNLLKNHLTARGHVLAQRLTIGRGLQQTAFHNLPPHSLSRLTPELLSRYDVLLTDNESLTALSGPESQALARALRTDGLGLVLTAGAGPLPASLPGKSAFQLAAQAMAPEQATPLRWSDGRGSMPLPAVLGAGPLLRPLVQTAKGTGLAAAAYRAGWGSVVVATPTETYRWLLGGQTATYDAYWARLLTAAARPLATTPRWHVNAYISPHEPLTIRLAGSTPAVAAEVRAPSGQLTRVGLRSAVSGPAQATALFWPRHSGWHTVRLPGQAPTSFFVLDSAGWLAPIISHRWQAAQQRAVPSSAHAGSGTGEDQAPDQEPVVPLFWFYGLFVLSAGFLWLEEKL
ncbi:hypothetical protein [Hymenobacter sp. B81]|uniref:hypothetical protein n=1 Tax=Hymenobacter sp. B81 TaxID=3344878 RepID=UPI0037DBFF05